jgi:hypothetical protein
LIWAKNSQKIITSKSSNFDLLPHEIKSLLVALPDMLSAAKIYQISNKYYIIRSCYLTINNKIIGKLYFAQDVTFEESMYIDLIINLVIASIITIILIILLVAWYIKYSLKPLSKLNKITANISTEDFNFTKLQFDQAPSEVKELAFTISNLLSRLSLVWEREREFTSNVSHELRTPLTIVYGYLQSVLRRQNNLTETQIEALKIAASEADRTISMLQNLLDLARADNGYLHLEIKTEELNKIVREVVDMSKIYSNREFIFDSETPLIKAKCDYNKLKQILVNLIDNAINYSQPETPIIIRLKTSQEYATIQVTDLGCGISLQNQSRIFERFYRVDQSRNRNSGGCGLGLSIVKSLVEAMEGSIKVESKLGQGSTFMLSLLLA